MRILVPPLLSHFPDSGSPPCAGLDEIEGLGYREPREVRRCLSWIRVAGPQTVLGSRGRKETLFETYSVSDIFLNFFQTKILFNQLYTFKLREYRRVERNLQLILVIQLQDLSCDSTCNELKCRPFLPAELSLEKIVRKAAVVLKFACRLRRPKNLTCLDAPPKTIRY